MAQEHGLRKLAARRTSPYRVGPSPQVSARLTEPVFPVELWSGQCDLGLVWQLRDVGKQTNKQQKAQMQPSELAVFYGAAVRVRRESARTGSGTGSGSINAHLASP